MRRVLVQRELPNVRRGLDPHMAISFCGVEKRSPDQHRRKKLCLPCLEKGEHGRWWIWECWILIS